MDRSVEFGGRRYPWQWWDGERLSGSVEAPVAVDTETDLIRDPLYRPRVAVAMAFDGTRLVMIHPSRVAEWLSVHRREHLVFYNVGFDFDVLLGLLDGQPQRQRLLWDAGDAGRLHCGMVVDVLLQLATGQYSKANFGRKGKGREEEKLYPRNLAAACAFQGLPEVDKTDPFRLRFGELLGLTQGQIDAHPEFVDGFARYALGDVIATHELYKRQRVQALSLMRAAGWSDKPQPRYEIRHDAVERWGPLTERIQVQAAIVLYRLSRTPLHIDRERRDLLEAELRVAFECYREQLDADAPGLFRTFVEKKRAGQPRLTKKSGVQSMDQTVLRATLVRQAEQLGFEPPRSDGKQKLVSVSTKAWRAFVDRSPFVAAWCEWERIATLLGFLRSIDSEKVYASYSLLQRSGRTSAEEWKADKHGGTLPSMNVQQMPKDERFRHLVLPPPGQKFVIVDYAFIELRTLAALAASRFGESKLRDAVVECTLHGGLDPHQRTAARMLGVSEAEYLRLPPEQQKKARQDAKAVNFGLPGGLGIETLIAYAKMQYDVDLTRATAKAAKAAWLATYPEMARWLEDRTVDGVRYQLGEAAAKVFAKASWWRRRAATDWLRGAEQTATTAEAGREVIESVCIAAKRYDLAAAAADGERTPALKKITQYRATTLTGRVRADTGFTETANSPFQGLASDGAKLALWRLAYAGYTVSCFVHDECLVSVPAATANADLRKVQAIMNAAMNEVLDGVPSATEGRVADFWAKR